jgi:hypothetical protein
MLLTARLDTETANQAVSDGTLPKIIDGIVEQLKPEAAYFTSTEGDRTCFLVLDMKDASQMPTICEPFFHAGAKVSLRPAMNVEDLHTGLSSLGR